MRRLLLIAGREFKAYVATATFWAALAIGPLMTLAAFGLMTQAQPPPAPLQVALAAEDPQLRAAAAAALVEAGRVMHRPVRLAPDGDVRLSLHAGPQGPVAALSGARLPPAAREVFRADLERRLAPALAARAGAPADALSARLSLSEPPAGGEAIDAGAAARFGLVFILWLTLTGSLGMLLQAVARERANRALDILMAAARPAEIVFGKLVGVGAVSLLVLAAWLGPAAALGAATGAARAGPLHAVLTALADPGLLAKALVAYVLAYAAYGGVTIALGTAARDVASAQNLSRPMFGVLLVAFFAALVSAMGAADGLAWTVWLPPLTPFMWLLSAPGALSAPQSACALALMCAAALAAGLISKECLSATRHNENSGLLRRNRLRVGRIK